MENQLGIDRADIYNLALTTLNDAGIQYMLGGAMAVYHYTNWWRSTHDIDIYIVHEDLCRAKAVLDAAGFEDIGEQAEGDHEWIYHAVKESLIVDLIWRFANLANYVSRDWFDRAPKGTFLGLDVRFLPLEEAIWIKTFVINRHRCDWPDVMRVIRKQCRDLDWDRLLNLLGEHWLLLAGLIDVFDWQYPESIGCVPRKIRDELLKRRVQYWDNENRQEVQREHLLDPWITYRADRYATRRDE